MTNAEIGEMIRARRLSRGMTQSQLASAAGMSESAIAMYEAGKRRPRENAVEALADAFNVPKWAICYSEKEIFDQMSEFTEDERRIVYAYRAADPIYKSIALELLELHPALKESLA